MIAGIVAHTGINSRSFHRLQCMPSLSSAAIVGFSVAFCCGWEQWHHLARLVHLPPSPRRGVWPLLEIWTASSLPRSSSADIHLNRPNRFVGGRYRVAKVRETITWGNRCPTSVRRKAAREPQPKERMQTRVPPEMAESSSESSGMPQRIRFSESVCRDRLRTHGRSHAHSCCLLRESTELLRESRGGTAAHKRRQKKRTWGLRLRLPVEPSPNTRSFLLTDTATEQENLA